MNKWILFAWRVGDIFYRRCRKFDFDDFSGTNIFRVTIKPYHGPDICAGGQWLRRGDLIGELHLYNYRLQKIVSGITSEVQLGLMALREVRKSLPTLHDFLETHPSGKDVKALVGISILHKGASAFGFQVFELEDNWYKALKIFYMKWMMRLCHPAGKQRIEGCGDALIPKRIVLMRDLFEARYGQKSICLSN